MRKNNGKKDNRSEKVFLVCILIIIILSFFSLVPKVASTVFPQKRTMLLNNFLESTKNSKGIHSQSFWEFREFYSPGYFVFEPRGLKKTDVDSTLKKLDVPLRDKVLKLSFHIFNSPYLISLDSLTNKKRLQDIIDIQKLSQYPAIYQDDKTYIYNSSDNTITLIFLASTKEMEKANGFFDYKDHDKKIVTNTYWLDITRVNKN